MSPYTVPDINKYKIGKRTTETTPDMVTYQVFAGLKTFEILDMFTLHFFSGFPIKLNIKEYDWESRNNIFVEIKKHGKIYTGQFSLDDTKEDISYEMCRFKVENRRGKPIEDFEKTHIEAIKDTPKDLGRYGKRILKNIKVFENNAKLLVEDLDKKFG